ncbi:MAG: transposase [Dissulfurispiraceae bacterium]
MPVFRQCFRDLFIDTAIHPAVQTPWDEWLHEAEQGFSLFSINAFWHIRAVRMSVLSCVKGLYPDLYWLAYLSKTRKRRQYYMGTDCVICPHNKGCTKSRTRGRRLNMFPYESESNPMTKAMKTTEAQKLYKLRWQTVESVLGL